ETGCYWLRHFAAETDKGPRQAQALEDRFREVVTSIRGSADALAANPYLLVSLISAVASGDLNERWLHSKGIVRSDLYRFMVDDALGRAATIFPGVSKDLLLDV